MISFIRLQQVEELIEASWRNAYPFSLVRVGDGELSVLTYPERTDDKRIQYVFRRAMADRPYTGEEIARVRAGMVRAVMGADVLGIHDSYHPNAVCVVYQEDLDAAGVTAALGCPQEVHIYLQSAGVLDRLMRSAERITLISGRDVLERVRAAWPHAEIDQLIVPVERQYQLAGESAGMPQHYPDAYQRILTDIAPRDSHHLYLVGAGLLGKEYCQVIKERGGFAIDIGSVFDYWAQVPTREGKRVIDGGKLVLDRDTSRWPGIMLGEHGSDGTALMNSPFRGMFRPMEIIPRPR